MRRVTLHASAAAGPLHEPRPASNAYGHPTGILFKFVWGLPAKREYDYWRFIESVPMNALAKSMQESYPIALRSPPGSLYEIRLMPGSRVTNENYTIIYSSLKGRDKYPPSRDLETAGVREGSVLLALVSQD